MTDQLALNITPIATIKGLVDVLADMGLDPLHLHIDGRKPTDSRPGVSMWMRYRTDYEQVVERLRLKSVERRATQHGQREWHAERDTDDMRLLVQCVSFEHHEDWEAS